MSTKAIMETLFIPLAGKIYTSKHFPDYFFDQKALEISQEKKNLPIVKNVLKKSSEYTMIAPAARYFIIDDMIKKYLKKHKKCNIINLGCGLETLANRITTDKAIIYEVDFPEVIKIRQDILGNLKNEVLVSGDIFDLKWIKAIDISLPTIAIASGVFMYFKKNDISKFIKDLKDRFANLELIFDSTDKKGIKYTNRYVKKTGNKKALMYFYIEDINIFLSQFVEAHLVESRPFFKEARRILKRRINLYTKTAMYVCDKRKQAMVYWLKLY